MAIYSTAITVGMEERLNCYGWMESGRVLCLGSRSARSTLVAPALLLPVLKVAQGGLETEDGGEADGPGRHDAAVPAREVPVLVRVVRRNGDDEKVGCDGLEGRAGQSGSFDGSAEEGDAPRPTMPVAAIGYSRANSRPSFSSFLASFFALSACESRGASVFLCTWTRKE